MMQNDPTAKNDEVNVMLRLQFKPGMADHVLTTLVPSAKLTRDEAGNLDFKVFRTVENADCLVLFERWKNKAALEQHWQEPYTKEILQLFQHHLIKPLSETDDVTYLSDAIQAAG